LATEEPLLLIGPHGTGKSLLLTRIAEALDLAFRHYNSSLLNFDDLVGFPLPNKNGSLEYQSEFLVFDLVAGVQHNISSHFKSVQCFFQLCGSEISIMFGDRNASH
jgi:ABC-type uncharacterized transport system YnjBCD ATPase subunit